MLILDKFERNSINVNSSFGVFRMCRTIDDWSFATEWEEEDSILFSIV